MFKEKWWDAPFLQALACRTCVCIAASWSESKIKKKTGGKHPKKDNARGFCFSAEKHLRKKCANSHDKIPRKKCVNHFKLHKFGVKGDFVLRIYMFKCFYQQVKQWLNIIRSKWQSIVLQTVLSWQFSRSQTIYLQKSKSCLRIPESIFLDVWHWQETGCELIMWETGYNCKYEDDMQKTLECHLDCFQCVVHEVCSQRQCVTYTRLCKISILSFTQ